MKAEFTNVFRQDLIIYMFGKTIFLDVISLSFQINKEILIYSYIVMLFIFFILKAIHCFARRDLS